MAVLAGAYGKTEPEFVGCVLETYERNGAWDSDWYAVVWDEKSQKVIHVEYDTTRAGGGGWAEIDATAETLHKVYRYYYNCARNQFDTYENEYQAKIVKLFDKVEVIRGRKVPKGTTATVFWIGEVYNSYTYHNEKRVGIETDGKRYFLPYDYVIPVDWQTRKITGKRRKEYLHKVAMRRMPGWVRAAMLRNP